MKKRRTSFVRQVMEGWISHEVEWEYKQRDKIQMKGKAVTLRKHHVMKSYSVEVCGIQLLLATTLNGVATVEFFRSLFYLITT